MLVSRRTFRAAQEEARRLQRELTGAQASLAQYKQHERELIDAVVAARVEARAVRSRAAEEAGAVVNGARDEALGMKAEASALLAEAHAEIARLREVQRELSASLEQSLGALQSVLPETPFVRPLRAGVNQAAGERVVQTPAPMALPVTVSAQLSPATLAPKPSPDQTAPPPFRRGAPVDREPRLPPPPVSFRLSAISWHRLHAFHTNSKLLKIGGLALICLVAAVGATRLWRDGPAERPASTASQTVMTRPAAENAASNSTIGTPSSRANPLPHKPGTQAQVGTSRVAVALTAMRPVWLRAEVDGREAVARMLRAREALEFRGAQDVVLRAGDAGALMMSVNGGAAAALGGDGAVVTRRVAADARRSAATVRTDAPRVAEVSRTLLARSNAAEPRSQLPAATTQLPSVDAMAPLGRAGRPLPAPPPPAPALAPLPAPASAVSLDSTDEGDVLRGHEAYFEALRRGDRGQLGRLVADGFSTSGAPATDASGLPYDISLRNASVEIRGVGAVVSGTASQRISGPEGQFLRDQQLLFSEVWIKRNGQWQLMNVRLFTPEAAR